MVIVFSKLLPGLIWWSAALQGLLRQLHRTSGRGATGKERQSLSTQRQQSARVAKLCIQGWKTQTATSLMGLAWRESYPKRLLATTSTTTSPRIHQYKVVCTTTQVAGGKSPSPAWSPPRFRQLSTIESPAPLELRIANASFIDKCCIWKVTWWQSVLLQYHERAGDHHLDKALNCGSIVYIKRLNARHWWHKPHFAEA